MSDWKWCHGPNCHTYHTQSRIRGVKGNKVLRTRKVSRKSWQLKNDFGTKYWDYFCDDRCKHDYFNKHLQAILRHEPRSEPLETSVEVTKETVQGHWGPYVNTTITEINNNQ